MQSSFARRNADGSYTLGNAVFAVTLGMTDKQIPVMRSLTSVAQPAVNWASPAQPLGPELAVAETSYSLGKGNITFQRFEASPTGAGDAELCIFYALSNGIEITQHLKPSPDKAVWRSWIALRNTTANAMEGISRFDALNTRFGIGDEEPLCTYLLGWLFGPRVDAPGRHTVPWAYPGWIPALLYGDAHPPLPFKPEAGWHAPIMRPIIGERLTRLPLRSGKRSTFENYPWVAVLAPDRQAGFFAGFTWSGTWKIDVEHMATDRSVAVSASSDGCIHTLPPGAELTSPDAFAGLFEGDWDEASNATRRFVVDEIMPPISADLPVITNDMSPLDPTVYRKDGPIWKAELDALAAAGVDVWDIDAGWWAERYQGNDFSLGLGCFEDNPSQWPGGFRAMSDYAHSVGLKVGLWFEIERVDIRTSNRGRQPWKPEWIVHQKGHAHRSWCQHVYCLCLGVKEAQDWAIDNLSWAIRTYDLDEIMIDSNEWAVCDDVSHGHGERDGEWAQIQGLYRVLAALRNEFPDLVISNLGGGSQRSDFGMARYSHWMCPSDVNLPVGANRRYNYGVGFVLPNGYGSSVAFACPDENTGKPIIDASGHIPREELEWILLSTMGGSLRPLMRMSQFDRATADVMRRALAFFRRIKPTLWGDRYVLARPVPFIDLEDRPAGNRDAGIWEAFQHFSRDRDLVTLMVYRCNSPESERRFQMRGLDAGAAYRIESYSGVYAGVQSGDALMRDGVSIRLEHTRKADILLLTRQS